MSAAPKFTRMYVAPGTPYLVCVAGTVKPINCGNAKIAALLAAAPDLCAQLVTVTNALESTLLVITDAEARQMAQGFIADARAVLAKVQP